MATKPRRVGKSIGHAAPYGRKVVSSVELARREWSSRNFRIYGVQGSIISICNELGISPLIADQVLAELIKSNNLDGRAKGLNIT